MGKFYAKLKLNQYWTAVSTICANPKRNAMYIVLLRCTVLLAPPQPRSGYHGDLVAESIAAISLQPLKNLSSNSSMTDGFFSVMAIKQRKTETENSRFYNLFIAKFKSKHWHQSCTLQLRNEEVNPWASSWASGYCCVHTSSCDNWRHEDADGHNI